MLSAGKIKVVKILDFKINCSGVMKVGHTYRMHGGTIMITASPMVKAVVLYL